MDHLREGIYLRGYGQKDPKKEYKKEGFDLFAQMMQNIKNNTAQKIFHVQIKREEEEIPEMKPLTTRDGALPAVVDLTGPGYIVRP